MKFLTQAWDWLTSRDSEIKPLFVALSYAEHWINSPMFGKVRSGVEDFFRLGRPFAKEALKNGIDPLHLAYSAIARESSNLLLSGEFHLYRGVLTPAGNELLRIHFAALEKIPSEDPANRNTTLIRLKNEMLEAIKKEG